MNRRTRVDGQKGPKSTVQEFWRLKVNGPEVCKWSKSYHDHELKSPSARPSAFILLDRPVAPFWPSNISSDGSVSSLWTACFYPLESNRLLSQTIHYKSFVPSTLEFSRVKFSRVIELNFIITVSKNLVPPIKYFPNMHDIGVYPYNKIVIDTR